jgi:putative endonuclease
MAKHNDVGREGEELAVAFLLRNGFSILHRNWRYGHLEIDLIAMKGNLIHFIEVKLRSSSDFMLPENSVNKEKRAKLKRAVEQFLFLHPQYPDCRIDILSITRHMPALTEFFFIEDVSL